MFILLPTQHNVMKGDQNKFFIINTKFGSYLQSTPHIIHEENHPTFIVQTRDSIPTAQARGLCNPLLFVYLQKLAARALGVPHNRVVVRTKRLGKFLCISLNREVFNCETSFIHHHLYEVGESRLGNTPTTFKMQKYKSHATIITTLQNKKLTLQIDTLLLS